MNQWMRLVPRLRSQLARDVLLGLGGAVLAMGGRAALSPWMGTEALPFVFAWPALALLSLYCGWRPALVLALAALAWSGIPDLSPSLVEPGLPIQAALFLPSALLVVFILSRVTRERCQQPAENPAPSSLVRWLRTSMVAAIVLPSVLFLLAAGVAYRDAFENATAVLEQTARTVEEHATKVFESNELLLRHMGMVLGDRTAENLRDSEAFLHEQLKDLTRELPQVHEMWIWDEHGTPVAGSQLFPAPAQLTVADHDYFAVHRQPDQGLAISGMLQSQSAPAKAFTLSKRRDLPGGSFGGVLSVSLPTEYFTAFYRELERSAPGLTVAMIQADGAILARLPQPPPHTRMAPEGPLMQRIAQGSSTATFFNTSAIDSVTRLMTYRKIGPYPVYAVAGISRSAILAKWHRYLSVLAAFTFPTALGLAYVSWVALRRVALEQAALQGQRAEAEARQRAENALHESRRLEALGRLTGGVAHDFNNLLAVISNNLYLHKRLAPAVADSPQLAAILRATDNGARLTRQLLAFSRQQALHPEVISLQRHLPELLPVLQATLGRHIEITLDVEPHVPAIKVDRSELELAIINLALNAKDAMPDGGQLQIRAAAAMTPPRNEDAAPSWVRITVSDTGHGIPPHVLPKVFEPFFTTKEQGKGTGLGLSQLYGFVKQAGGQVDIASEPGVSTTVTLHLPGTTESGAEPHARAKSSGVSLAARILLVEDNIDVGATTRDLLKASGCHVHHVPDGDAARVYLESGQASAIDLILSDIVMPGKTSGIALAHWIKTALPGMPVLLMTGYSGDVDAASQQEMTILQKPVSPETLIQSIRRALQKPAAPNSAPKEPLLS